MQQQINHSTKNFGVVAIVEDDPELCHALGAWLSLHDFRASVHDSAESLLKCIVLKDGGLSLSDDVDNPEFVPLEGTVIDVNLPGISGIALAQSLRRLVQDLPIVIITALRHNEQLILENLPPDIRCLKKPFELNALEEALFPLFP